LFSKAVLNTPKSNRACTFAEEIHPVEGVFYGKMYPMKHYKPVSLKGVKTYTIKKRKSKVSLSALSHPHERGDTLRTFLDKLPSILAVDDFKAVVHAIISARKNGKPVILGMGAHPIKVGLSPVIIDLMQKGAITALSTNGACIVHDFEISFIGRTSEDVAREICSGTFGMARETGMFLNTAIKDGIKQGYGIGKSVGEMIYRSAYQFKEKSIFANAYKLGIPSTVHVAIGTDIIHMHPLADGSAIGEGSFRDFRLFTSVVADLDGGVYLNLGSAVIMPEVFLKALTIARNLGNKVEHITTVNMDFIQHYRPKENVLRRPTMGKGACYALTGHHEIMFPLLAAAVVEEMG
jgi:deoxyhypusine synthase